MRAAESELPNHTGVPQIADEIIQAKPSQTTKMIEIAQVQGQVHAQSVQKVGELAERNPNETAAIVRHWLHEVA
jgi:flagellar M-ring protein FliF